MERRIFRNRREERSEAGRLGVELERGLIVDSARLVTEHSSSTFEQVDGDVRLAKKEILRSISGLVIVLAILGSVAGLAWLSRHPEAEVLRRAQDLPWIGSLVLHLREAYVRAERRPGYIPGERSVPGDEGRGRESRQPPLPEPPGGFSKLWVLAGTWALESPRPGASEVHRFPSTLLVSQLERRGDWYRVWRGGVDGWVYLPNYEEPPLGREAEAPKPLPPRPPDAEKLATAETLLGEGAEQHQLGPYAFYTDVRDPELLAALGQLVPGLEDHYRQRYGLSPLGSPLAALVLFADERPYREMQKSYPRLEGLHSAGFNAHGLAVSFVGARAKGEVLATLVHEIVHLMNRRSLGPALPPWIDEGLADEMSMARVGADGSIDPEILRGERQNLGQEIRYTGALASIRHLSARQKAGRLRPLGQLLGLDWASFVGPPHGSVHYAQAAFFARFLLNGSQEKWRAGFQDFLRAVASGEHPESVLLTRSLDIELPALDAAFRAWLSFQTERPEFRILEAAQPGVAGNDP